MSETPRILAGRYVIARELGRGSFATTWLGRRLKPDEDPTAALQEAEGGLAHHSGLLAIKELRVGRGEEQDGERSPAQAMKHIELFEREAKVMALLRHPGIPRMIESFEHERAGGGMGLYLVQEFIQGPSLRERMTQGPLMGGEELRRCVDGLLDVLEYLHGRAPPVFHRDIKPSNILMRADGTPVLVDFGGVCFGWRPPSQLGTTVVGTFGYMPPEQLLGHVGATSDLYALGATLLEVVSGVAPHEHSFETGRLEVPEGLSADKQLLALIDALLQPAPRKRPASAAAARAILEAKPSSLGQAGIVAMPAPTTAIAVMGGDGPRFADVGAPTRDIQGPHREIYLDLIDPFAVYRNIKNPIARTLAVIGIAVGTLGIFTGLYYLETTRRAAKYTDLFISAPMVVGKILAVTQEEGAVSSHVKFAYVVNGTEYRGFISYPIRFARYWSEGDPVAVLYNEDNPSESCFVFRRPGSAR